MVVRNFYETFRSVLMLFVLKSHSLVMENKPHEDHPAEFAEYVDLNIDLFNRFYNVFMEMAKEKKYPVIFQRYEDAVKDKENHLVEAYDFFIGQDIKDTYLHKKIKEVCNSGSAGHVYKKKTPSKGFEQFTEEQLKTITEKTKEFCAFFGYDDKGEALSGEHPFHLSNQEHKKWFRDN